MSSGHPSGARSLHPVDGFVSSGDGGTVSRHDLTTRSTRTTGGFLQQPGKPRTASSRSSTALKIILEFSDIGTESRELRFGRRAELSIFTSRLLCLVVRGLPIDVRLLHIRLQAAYANGEDCQGAGCRDCCRCETECCDCPWVHRLILAKDDVITQEHVSDTHLTLQYSR